MVVVVISLLCCSLVTVFIYQHVVSLRIEETLVLRIGLSQIVIILFLSEHLSVLLHRFVKGLIFLL